MDDTEKAIVRVGPRVSQFIGAKASREKKLQAAGMQAEFTLRDTLIILCYLSKDADREVSTLARKNLIPACRNWFSRADRPELPEPIHQIVMKVIEQIGAAQDSEGIKEGEEEVRGNIGLLGLGEMIQAVDHNHRTVSIELRSNGESATVFTRDGKVVGAVSGDRDGLPALFEAFRWGDARFRYLHAPAEGFTNEIQINTLNLIMEALDYAPERDPFESDQSWTWKVEGNLRVLNIFEIAEIFEMNSKQAVCTLTTEDSEGRLFFNEGRIINATLGEMTGLEAACHLLAWPSASFVVARGGQDVPELIRVGMQNLILEAMRLVDEGAISSDRISEEMSKIDQLFDLQPVASLPILEKVRLVFSDDERAREALATDTHPLVRKAVKVKISKTVHKYLTPTTDHSLRLSAARGRAPVSTTEKLVLLSYLSHDDSAQIREEARKTLNAIDLPTYRRAFASDMHPWISDFLVREVIRDEAVIRGACMSEGLLEETTLHILDHWRSHDTLRTILDNAKILESSALVCAKLYEVAQEHPHIRKRIETFEESMLAGDGQIKVEGHLSFCGVAGLMRATQASFRSGTVVLDGPEKSGRIFIHQGKIIGVLWDKLEGAEALGEIISQERLRFRYVRRTHLHVRNIEPAQAEKLLQRPGAGPRAREAEEGGFRLISGHPEAMDLYELLCALEGTPVPVRVTVTCEEGVGEVFRDGLHILHVALRGQENPLQAMAAVLSWTGTRLLVRDLNEDFPRTVQKPLGDFISEAIREMEEAFRNTPRPGELPEWELSESEYESLYHRISNMGVAEKIKLAFNGSKEARELLVRDSNKLVALAAVKSPKIQESEIEALSKSRSVCDDVLRYIADTKEWVSSYTVKVNLCSNSKTPVPIALKLLNHLRELELRKLAKSKNVSAVVSTQARRLAEARGGKH
ncbi:MAG: DUF4388 domain-containing protein [Deltaproteobacteria bacterium]|nr:DUF4388 domain-containing protein [Deltaproteobacteria bacterium]